jgi:hypothetical protein
MHLVKEVYRDVTNSTTAEVPEEFSNKTIICHLLLGAGEKSRRSERLHALHDKYTKYRSSGNLYRGDLRIYEYGAMKYLTNLKHHMIVNLECFMTSDVFAQCPGLSPEERDGPSSTASQTIVAMNRRLNLSTGRHHAGERMKLL